MLERLRLGLQLPKALKTQAKDCPNRCDPSDCRQKLEVPRKQIGTIIAVVPRHFPLPDFPEAGHWFVPLSCFIYAGMESGNGHTLSRRLGVQGRLRCSFHRTSITRVLFEKCVEGEVDKN